MMYNVHVVYIYIDIVYIMIFLLSEPQFLCSKAEQTPL